MKNSFILSVLLLVLGTGTALSQSVDLRITGNYTFYFDVDEDEGTSDWYFSATDETGLYTVRLDWPSEEEGKYGTYTYKDLDHDYSYIKDFSSGEMEYLNYVEGTSFTVSDNNGKLHIEGTLVCDNGVTYNLWMEHTPQTYNIEGTELLQLQYYDEDTDWYMLFKDDRFRVSLDVNTGSRSCFTGSYTEADAITDYCFVTDLSSGSGDYLKTMNISLSIPDGAADPADACEIRGTALSEHGDTYNLHMLKGLPITPIKEVYVDASVDYAEWPSEREDCKAYFELTDKNHPQQKWTIGLASPVGDITTDYIIDSLTCRLDSQTGEKLRFDNGTATILYNSLLKSVESSVSLVMKDSIEYNLNFDIPIEIKGEQSYSFGNISVNDSYYEEMGYQWLYMKNDSCSVEVTLTGADVPGEYDNNSCYIEMAVTGKSGLRSAVKSIAVFSASTSLDEHNQPVFQTLFLGDNQRMYTLNAHFDIPAVVDTVTIAADNLKVRDLLESMGAFQIYGYSSDSSAYVSLAPVAQEFTGHYTTEDLAEFRNYCVIALRQADGNYETNDIYTAYFSVEREGRTVTLAGCLQAGAHYVILNLAGTIRPDGIDYDSEDEDLDVTFAPDDLYTLEEGDGYGYVEFRNSGRGDIFAILFYLDEFDPDIVIPEGTYEVNSSYEAPSVQPGELGSMGLYPAYYATLGEDGYLYTPFWFLETGTVTVSKTPGNLLQLEVCGQNSYERTIHVVYDPEGCGTLELWNSGAQQLRNPVKRMEDGHLVIYKNGRKFTAEGIETKNY